MMVHRNVELGALTLLARIVGATWGLAQR